MNPADIHGATRILNKPKNWDDEKHGTCGQLQIKDSPHQSGNVMISNWKPSADELERLNKGAFVQLWVLGETHPPVSVHVGPVRA